jgi:predicted metal-dependent hydrolase
MASAAPDRAEPVPVRSVRPTPVAGTRAPGGLPPGATGPVLRRPALPLDELEEPVWNPGAAEFVASANAVSLLMPFVEPYFAGAVRRALPQLEPDLAATARTFVRQELEHQRQHRRFNRRLVAHFGGLRRPEERARRVFDWLARTRSLRFSVAFAAASETVAYSLARWTSDHMAEFLRGADPVATDLFVWHLAEEVEHKSVAFDVWRAVDGSRWRYLRAGALSLVLLAWLSLWAIAVQLHQERRLQRPSTWWRTARLLLGFTFEVVPAMAMSAVPGHHPDQLVDPDWYGRWLVDLELRRGRHARGSGTDARGDEDTGADPALVPPTPVSRPA